MLDLVSDDFGTVAVTRKDNRNVVVLSESTYNNIMENLHIMGDKENYDWIMESIKQIEDGHVVEADI